MKLLILVFVSTFLVVGCGRANQDPAFAPYIEQWKIDAAANGLTGMRPEILSINFEPNLIQNGIEGTCEGSFIVIDNKIWNSFNETQRKLLIYHELGHCMLNKDHSTNLRDIMSYDAMAYLYQGFLNSPETILFRYFKN